MHCCEQPPPEAHSSSSASRMLPQQRCSGDHLAPVEEAGLAAAVLACTVKQAFLPNPFISLASLPTTCLSNHKHVYW